MEKINPGEDGIGEQESTGATMGIGGGFSKNTKISYHKDESKVEFKFFHRDTCLFVFIAAQFTIT